MYLAFQAVPAGSDGIQKGSAPKNKKHVPTATSTASPAPQVAQAPSMAVKPVTDSGTTTSQQVSPEAPPLPLAMNTILWIGLGFLIVLVGFLIYSVYKPPPRGSQGRKTMRFLTALCAGFSAGFLTGAALFNATFTHGLWKLSLSGSAGIALFFLIWLTYEKFSGEGLDIDDNLTIDMTPKWTFRAIADRVTGKMKAGVDYGTLTDAELNARMKKQTLTSDSVEHLLEALRNTTESEKIRPYKVTKEISTLHPVS